MTSESVVFQHCVGSCHFPSCAFCYFNPQAYYLIHKMTAKKVKKEICAAAPNHLLPFCSFHILGNSHLGKSLFSYSQVKRKWKDQLSRAAKMTQINYLGDHDNQL